MPWLNYGKSKLLVTNLWPIVYNLIYSYLKVTIFINMESSILFIKPHLRIFCNISQIMVTHLHNLIETFLHNEHASSVFWYLFNISVQNIV